jgi:PAS domain S-box-containing protein
LDITTLLISNPYLDRPNQVLGWVGWGILLVLLVLGLRASWEADLLKGLNKKLVLAGLAFLVPLTTLFFGLRLQFINILPLPGVPVEPTAPALMFLAALPWVLACGVLGVFPGVLVAFASGLVFAFWETHSLYTPLEIGGLALLYSLAIRQQYRTPFYRALRHPIGAAVAVAIVYSPVFLITSIVGTQGSIAARLDYASTQSVLFLTARAGELFIASLFAEVIYLAKVGFWGRHGDLIPSPSETNLQIRFLGVTVPLVVLMILVLTIGDWIVAGNAARGMMRERLASTSQAATASLPYFFETGQSIISNLADPGLLGQSHDVLSESLSKDLRSVPYFRQLFLFDGSGKPVTGYPEKQVEALRMSPEELAGIPLALKGVPVQVYTVPPQEGENSAQVSFLAGIKDSQGEVTGILLGRTDLTSNPFTQPMIESLNTMQEIGGQGYILDENQRILYYSVNPNSLVYQSYVGYIPTDTEFFSEASPTGTRNYGFFRQAEGKPWAIMLTLPASTTQQMALEIAIPLLTMLLLLMGISVLVVQGGLQGITASLKGLAQEAANISQGQMDHSTQVRGVDELGRLGRAFEQMRQSLKARLDELNKLLIVSQAVAGNLEVHAAIQPVLEAALGESATMARVVLVQDVEPDSPASQSAAFGAGPASEDYAYLDAQIYEMMRHQDILPIPNTGRIRRLNLPATGSRPGALLAVALHREHAYLGALWVAYDHPHSFSEEEVRFLNTLALEAALAASNARLYANAEIGRQRLEAVLDSTPEAVLVIDEKMCIFLINPAAMQMPGLVKSSAIGRPIQEVVTHPGLLELLSQPTEGRVSSREITLHNGKIYYLSASPVIADGKLVGKVCIMRDITYYKQLDSLKSDFVATVSHDLRSPLTLMRGYATMLQMVGDLNEQQKTYSNKIVTGVENMTRLVNNLLDLGRIEAGIGLQVEKVPASEVIAQVITSLQPQAAQKNLQLMLESPNQAVVVEADRALLQQAVYNLVENAIKYTSSGGQVKICLRVTQSGVVLEVRDTGIGIAPLDLPHMFEKFYRSGRREAYQQRGTGLGLAIVKSIAERHGGRVSVESQLGKGSTFYFELPYQQAQVIVPNKDN